MKQFLILLVLISCAAQAEIYKSQNEKGGWVYSDKPSPSAERMKLPPLSTYTPPPVRSQNPVPATGNVPGNTYKSMVFVAPENEATIRDNEGLVRVAVMLEPQLKSVQGHKIQFYLDGNPYGAGTVATGITLKNIDRGTHVVAARVLNAAGDPLYRADPVTFYIRRQSINFPGRQIQSKPTHPVTSPAPPKPKPKPRPKAKL